MLEEARIDNEIKTVSPINGVEKTGQIHTQN